MRRDGRFSRRLVVMMDEEHTNTSWAPWYSHVMRKRRKTKMWSDTW